MPTPKQTKLCQFKNRGLFNPYLSLRPEMMGWVIFFNILIYKCWHRWPKYNRIIQFLEFAFRYAPFYGFILSHTSSKRECKIVYPKFQLFPNSTDTHKKINKSKLYAAFCCISCEIIVFISIYLCVLFCDTPHLGMVSNNICLW